jgi:hypothetical protein
MTRERSPGEDKPQDDGFVPAQKPSIEVEREQAGVETEERDKPAAPGETLLPPD